MLPKQKLPCGPPATPVRFRPIAENPAYRVSRSGTIQSSLMVGGGKGRIGSTWRTLSQQTNRDGYRVVVLAIGGGYQQRFVHRLVLEAFVGPCPEGMECRHLDGNRKNNRLENLCWGSRQANADDRVRHSHQPKGEGHRLAKVAEADVLEMRRRFAAGDRIAWIARDFNLDPSTVGYAIRGKRWREAPGAVTTPGRVGRPRKAEHGG